jgi:hypothetical protein
MVMTKFSDLIGNAYTTPKVFRTTPLDVSWDFTGEHGTQTYIVDWPTDFAWTSEYGDLTTYEHVFFQHRGKKFGFDSEYGIVVGIEDFWGEYVWERNG